METFGLLRIRYPSFCEESFYKSISELSDTQYSLSVHYTDAPKVTHCVSAVRYAIERATGWQLPHYYVGNMCRKILDNRQIDSRIVSIEEGEIGDLIFFHKKSIVHRAYMITHVGILVDETSFFHSSWRKNGSIETIDSQVHQGNIASCKILTKLTDPRGK